MKYKTHLNHFLPATSSQLPVAYSYNQPAASCQPLKISTLNLNLNADLIGQCS